MSLYELAENFRGAEKQLNEMLEAGEIDDSMMPEILGNMSTEVKEKAKSVSHYLKNIEADCAAIKEAEKNMSERRKRLEAHHARITSYLKNQMEKCGITKIECPYFVISLKKNPPKLILDESNVDDEFKITQTVTAIDKQKIKSRLKDGEKFDFACLEAGTRLDIK